MELFYTDFCRPADVTELTVQASVAACMDFDQTSCTTNKQCAWGNVKDIKPANVNQFCVVNPKFPYPANLAGCLEKKTETDCGEDTCKWFDTTAEVVVKDHCDLKEIFKQSAIK